MQNKVVDAEFQLDWASKKDEPGIMQLLDESVMEGIIRLKVQKKPSFLDAEKALGQPAHIAVARDSKTGQVIGIGCRTVQNYWIEGKQVKIGYLNHLRRSHTLRNRIHLLRQAYQKLETTRQTDELRFDITSIATANKPARRLLEKGVKGFPNYKSIGNYVVLTFNATRCRKQNHQISKITNKKELQEVTTLINDQRQYYDLAPSVSFDDLSNRERRPGLALDHWRVMRKNGKLIGCCALWDKRPFEQLIVDRYSKQLRAGKFFINVIHRFLGKTTLPPPGTVVPMGFAAYLCAMSNHTETLISLLRSILADAYNRKIKYVNFGLAANNPLLSLLQSTFTCHSFFYTIFAVSYDPTPALFNKFQECQFHLEASIL